MNSPVYAIVPASGIGSRMQADRPKQYLPLHGKTVIEHTLERLLAFDKIEKVIVVIAADDDYWCGLNLSQHPRIETCVGGELRADSVLNGLQYLRAHHVSDDAWVMVHDAARPCIRQSDLIALYGQATVEGAILGLPVRDTMKRTLSDRTITATVDRDNLWHALTPQLSSLGNLFTAINAAKENHVLITDESSALEWAGFHPIMVLGHVTNIKITHPDDLELAEIFLKVAE